MSACDNNIKQSLQESLLAKLKLRSLLTAITQCVGGVLRGWKYLQQTSLEPEKRCSDLQTWYLIDFPFSIVVTPWPELPAVWALPECDPGDSVPWWLCTMVTLYPGDSVPWWLCTTKGPPGVEGVPGQICFSEKVNTSMLSQLWEFGSLVVIFLSLSLLKSLH